MGRGRDEFWDHAEKLNGGKRFRCNYCKSEYGGGATRIKSHLAQLKGGDIQICPKVLDHVRLAAIRAIDHHDQGSFSNKKKKVVISKKTKKKSIACSSCSSQTEMGHIRNLLHPDDDDDTKLAKFMISHSLPFDVVDELVKCVADFGSNHQHSSARATLERHLEYDIPKQVEEYTKHAEESLLQTGCTLIYNREHGLLYAWTSKGLLFKDTLPFNEAREDDNYLKWLSSKIQSVGPNHILQLVIDDRNGEFHEKIDKKVFTDYPWVHITHCATQEILSFFFDLGDVECPLITSGSVVFMYMKKNHPNLVPLTESDLYSNAQSSSVAALASQLTVNRRGKVPSFVLGFLRLKLLLGFEDRLQALPLPVQFSNDSIDSRFFYSAIKHKRFWEEGKQAVHALHPLLEAFCLLITNNASVGYLYQLMERAKNLIQGLENSSFKDHVLHNFNKMCERIIGPIHAVAALLNPAYLCSEDFRKENKDMKEGIDFVLKNIVEVKERNDFMSQLITYRSKNTRLFTLSAHALLSTSHPGVWWEYCGHCVPVLQKYALKIVTQPCSSFFTDEDLDSMTIDQLITKIMMMKISVTPKAHPADATKLVDQLAAHYYSHHIHLIYQHIVLRVA